MKKKLMIIMVLVSILFIPFSVFAKEKKYNTLDFEQTLKEEGIKPEYKEYKPDSNAITIYMFRGKGCGYCRAFLTFMNSITEEYGKYFKMETFEIWNDSTNSALMSEVSSYLGQPATGVPYVIIGDKVFGGYSKEYDEKIKEAIKEVYNTKKNKRYDVFKSMDKNKNSLLNSDSLSVAIWSLIFTSISTIILMSFISLKFKELNNKIDNLNIKEKTVVKENKSTKKDKK